MARVKVRMLPGGEELEVEVEGEPRAGELLARLGLDPESHVVLVDGRPVPESEPVKGREVVVVRVLSGGQV